LSNLIKKCIGGTKNRAPMGAETSVWTAMEKTAHEKL